MANITLGTSSIRELDGLFSLNDLHQAAGGETKHRPNQFLRIDTTQALISEIATAQISAVKTIEGRNGGTYACRELVIAYAAWISPAFHIHVLRTFLGQHGRTLPAPIPVTAGVENAITERALQLSGEAFKLAYEFIRAEVTRTPMPEKEQIRRIKQIELGQALAPSASKELNAALEAARVIQKVVNGVVKNIEGMQP